MALKRAASKVASLSLALLLCSAKGVEVKGGPRDPQPSYFEQHLRELLGGAGRGSEDELRTAMLNAAWQAQAEAEAHVAGNHTSEYLDWRRRNLQEEGRSLEVLGGGAGVQAVQPPGLNSAPVVADFNISLYRYASVPEPAWVDWRVSPVVNTGMFDQGSCESCWVVAATDVVSMYTAMANRLLSPITLSPQHVCDCGLRKCCSGGWPEWAFLYIQLNQGVAPITAYPYVGRDRACSNVAPAQRAGQISGWEKVPAWNIWALRQAVAQHPVLTFVAVSSSFLSYSGGIYYGTDCPAFPTLNHALIVMGYNLSSSAPYWIAKNSWGLGWGEGGFIRIYMSSGRPVCGFGTQPSMYPHVYQLRTPCDVTPSPCGGGTCYVLSNAARCLCPSGFVEKIESSHPKCVVALPCNANPNPCGIGSCNNMFDGSYTCNCPPGTVIGSRADGAMTCNVNTFQSGLQTYTSLDGDTCMSINSTFGLSQSLLLTQNPFIDCGTSITAGTIVIVAGAEKGLGCASMDVVQPGDQCADVASRNGISTPQLLSINPGTNCASLRLSQPLCVLPGQLAPTSGYERSCGATYITDSNDNCLSIVVQQNVSLITLEWLNPGLDCTVDTLPSALTVCVAPLAVGVNTGVFCTQFHNVTQVDTCFSVASAANLTLSTFLQFNPGLKCYGDGWKVGMTICIGGTFASADNSGTPPNLVPYYVQTNDTLLAISLRFGRLCSNAGNYSDPVALAAFSQTICAANGFPSCLDRWVVVGNMMLIPCLKSTIGTLNCADITSTNIFVCGADQVTYTSYACACNALATPVLSYAPCTGCQQYCVSRAGVNIQTFYGFLPPPCPVNQQCPYPAKPPLSTASQLCTPTKYDAACELLQLQCADSVSFLPISYGSTGCANFRSCMSFKSCSISPSPCGKANTMSVC